MEKFPEEVRRVLQDLIESQDGEYVLHPRGKDLVIENRYDLCFVWFATLTDVSGLPEEAEDGWTLWCSDIRAEGDGYILIGDADGPESDECMDVELRFSDVTVDLEAVRGDPAQAHAAPWWMLAAFADGIIRKSEVAPQLMNERERELLPLLHEIAMLTCWRGIQEGRTRMEFPLLRQRMDPKLHRLLDQVERSGQEWKQYFKATNRLQTQLNRSKYEHIWRGIYEAYAASQEEYPAKRRVSEGVRREIEEKLHAQGYSGSYPDFVKCGEVRGLRVRESYGQTFFICNEKNAVFHIHCREHSGWGDVAQLEFLCGTQFLRMDETAGDILSCMFRAEGRRLIGSVVNIGTDDMEDLERKLAIAVKKAELTKLTKEERRIEGNGHGLLLFLLFFLLGGGMFAILFIPAMALLGAIITGLLVGWQAVPDMFRELPWLELFGLTWALFGGVMGVVTVIGERNK